ncbi:MAG: gamma-glutamyltransferase [Anaerolineae bacterium]|jgi:gamma-glutamyltranspeptidase/glutathione hydrolase
MITKTSAAHRSPVLGFNGACATSQPLAAQAGLQMLLQGGNAVDAALAAITTLNVVEPMSTGMGGDLFALVYVAAERKVYALNASGRSGAGWSYDAYRARGMESVPERGAWAVTVPGAADGWYQLSARLGRLPFERVLQSAIRYAKEGFAVSPIIAGVWRSCEALLQSDPEAARTYLVHGRAPRLGERFCQPDLARSLRLLAEQGPDAFYRGPIAQAIASTIARHGALLTAEDLAAHTSTWVEPISTDYHGLQVWECPPNGQGIVALEALNILSGVDLAGMPFDAPDTVHWKIEALKLALADALGYVADPEHVRVPVDELLSPEHAARRRAEIDLQRATPNPLPGLDLGNDTVYATAVDSEGNAASIINSIFLAFGSGLVAEGTGICLQNRGHLFVMDPEHPNCIAPNKRPFHTIIPCMATRNGDLRMSFGVMGGAMQPQGHVQVLTNMLDHDMDVQAAIDAPRFYYQPGSTHLIEPYFADETLAELRRRGHDFTVDEGGIFGGAQIILVDPDSGALVCGSEPRKDGCAVAY